MNEKNFFKDSQIVRDARTGRLCKIRGEFDLPAAGKTEDSVKSFLFANADKLELTMQANELKKVQDIEMPSGRMIRFEQTRNGIPIFGTRINVHLDPSSIIRQIDMTPAPSVKILAAKGKKKVIAVEAAITATTKVFGEYTLRRKVEDPKKVYFPTMDGLRLAFDILVLTRNPTHDLRMIVDAYTGEVLTMMDLIKGVNGQGLVFDPNPVVTGGTNTYRDPSATIATCGFTGTSQATIDAQRVTRTLNNITLSGGKHKLEGDFVKIVDLNPPTAAPPNETGANNFNYPSNNDSFEAVMVYYHVDTLQRYIQNTLGITTANNRQIEADPHDESYYDGAWYSGGDLSLHFGNSGPCKPDRAEDADCMFHEYNHAIMDNITPGYAPWVWNPATSQYHEVHNAVTGRAEAGALGEGFGDILACVYFAPDHSFQREVFEDWVFAPGGLRRVDGTKIYPDDLVDEVHLDGEIWSAALWNIYLTIGGDDLAVATQRAARDELLKTMISSYPSLGATPNMMEAAAAIMDTNAEIREYRLAHGIEMLDSFHDRGILHCETGSNLKVIELWSQQSKSPAVGYQQVEAGQDNWFYARVRNDGTAIARAFVVEFSFKSPFSAPVYPADFRDHIISGAVGYDLAPGAVATVKARWPKNLIPAIPTGSSSRHGCIFAEVYNPVDYATPATSIGYNSGSASKLMQCNTTIVDLLPDETTDYFFNLSNYHLSRPQLVRLELIRPPKWKNLEVTLHHHDPRVIETFWKQMEAVNATMVKPLEITDIRKDFFQRDAEFVSLKEQTFLKLKSGLKVGCPYLMKPRERLTIGVRIRAPKNAKRGDQIKLEMIQRDTKGNFVGGFDVLINVVAKHLK